jgi:hypothetical protein
MWINHGLAGYPLRQAATFCAWLWMAMPAGEAQRHEHVGLTGDPLTISK